MGRIWARWVNRRAFFVILNFNGNSIQFRWHKFFVFRLSHSRAFWVFENRLNYDSELVTVTVIMMFAHNACVSHPKINSVNEWCRAHDRFLWIRSMNSRGELVQVADSGVRHLIIPCLPIFGGWLLGMWDVIKFWFVHLLRAASDLPINHRYWRSKNCEQQRNRCMGIHKVRIYLLFAIWLQHNGPCVLCVWTLLDGNQ